MTGKRKSLLCATSLLLSVAAVIISQHASFGDEHKPPVTAAAQGLQFVAKPQKEIYGANEPVMVDLTIANNSSNSVSYVSRGILLKEFSVVVSDQKGMLIPLTRYGASIQHFRPPTAVGLNILTEIKPHDKMVYHFLVSRQYDMTVSGNYYVSISRDVLLETGNSVNVVSNSALVKIVEPTD